MSDKKLTECATDALDRTKQYILQSNLDDDILIDLVDTIHDQVLIAIEQMNDRCSNDIVNIENYR